MSKKHDDDAPAKEPKKVEKTTDKIRDGVVVGDEKKHDDDKHKKGHKK